MEKKNIVKIILLLTGIIILIAGLWYWTKPKEATGITTDIVLFYGLECPHCQDLEKFVEENKIAEKVQFDRLEVFHNRANRKILAGKARECGIENKKDTGVPFLYDLRENQCFIGTPDIEDFFTKKVQSK
ncbi:MAG: hypothetical protein V1690_02955 [Candidatus Moraniibacteriota bacterium]